MLFFFVVIIVVVVALCVCVCVCVRACVLAGLTSCYLATIYSFMELRIL